MRTRLEILLGAAKAARKQIRRDRRTIVVSHASAPGFDRVETVTDPVALEWIAEHDAALRRLDNAIALFEGVAP